GLVHRHGMGDAARILDDLDRAVEHNVEGEAAVPFREEDVACLDVADAAAGTEQIDLGVGQLWKRGFSFGRHGGRSWARPAHRGLGRWLLPVIANMSSVRGSVQPLQHPPIVAYPQRSLAPRPSDDYQRTRPASRTTRAKVDLLVGEEV